jgi:hypothetical protein
MKMTKKKNEMIMSNSRVHRSTLSSQQKRRRTLIGTFIAVALLVATSIVIYGANLQSTATNTIRVLFVGNSQTDFWDLPATVEALAKSAPVDRPRITVGKAIMHGTGLAGYWDSGEGFRKPRSKIKSKKWDYVVIQDAYASPVEMFRKYALLFHDAINRTNAKTILFATASTNDLYPSGFKEIYEMHSDLSKELGVPLAAGGYAWLKYWGTNPTLEQRLSLYASDKAHPGERGSYIYACVLYSAITGFSPIGLTHDIPNLSPNAVTKDKAYAFQLAAWNQHLESNSSQPTTLPTVESPKN